MNETTILFYASCILDIIGITLFYFVIKFLRDFKKYKRVMEGKLDSKLIKDNTNNIIDVDELKIEVDNLKTSFSKLNKNTAISSTTMNITISNIRDKIADLIDSLKQAMEMLKVRIELIEKKQENLNNYKQAVKEEIRKKINIGLRELKNKGKIE